MHSRKRVKIKAIISKIPLIFWMRNESIFLDKAARTWFIISRVQAKI